MIHTIPNKLEFSLQNIAYPPTPPGSSLDLLSESNPFNPLLTVPSPPREIPTKKTTVNYGLATPPLTPETPPTDGTFSAVSDRQSDDALDFLATLFPHDALAALPFAKNVTVSSPETGITAIEGVVLELPGKPKTLYVDGKVTENIDLRESIVALLDLADEHLQCEALVLVLDRSHPLLSVLLHSLMYVGGTVVTRPPFKVDPGFVLVGLEI